MFQFSAAVCNYTGIANLKIEPRLRNHSLGLFWLHYQNNTLLSALYLALRCPVY